MKANYKVKHNYINGVIIILVDNYETSNTIHHWQYSMEYFKKQFNKNTIGCWNIKYKNK